MKTMRILAALMIVCALGVLAQGAVNVGDSPALKFKAADGAEIDLANYKGKVVVIDFWATWCGPCMAQAGHMVELNKKYAEKGMQIIGVSLDQKQDAMEKVCKEKGFTWPQYFLGKAAINKVTKEWGVRGIPHTFIIDKEGKVVWAGHPAQIDGPLAKAMGE